MRLSSTARFDSRRRVLVYRYRGLQSSWHRQPKLELESSLACWHLFEVDWAVGMGSLYSPFVQADLVIGTKKKKKTQKRTGVKQGRLGKRVGKDKQRESQTLLYLAYTSKAVVRRRTLLQTK